MSMVESMETRSFLLACVAATALACGFDDPALDETFDPATAEGPPARAAVEPDPNRNLVACQNFDHEFR